MKKAHRWTTLTAAFLLSLLAPAFAQDAPASIGSRLELFADQSLIDRMDGTRLELHKPLLAENVLAFDKPWEGLFCGYVTVFMDGPLYRMYYRGLPEVRKDGSDAEVTCYAESTDGVTWTKPNLGLFEIAGSKDNNVILAGHAPYSHNFSPFKDTKPGVPAAEQYKALAGTSETGLIAFVSEDGLRWTKRSDTPVITEGAFDSQNVAFWSESENEYVSYFRTWREGDFKGHRTVSRATSQDFFTWTKPEYMEFGGTPPEHLYTNQTAPYFRAPHIYIATAARFMPERRVISAEKMKEIGGEASYSGDCSDTVLITSRGGTVYDRTFMEGFIRPGIGAGNWTSRTNYPARGVVPTGADSMSLYVQRNYGQVTHHLQRLTLRTDGFISINAPYTGGEAVTKPFTFTGKSLVINYATSAAGSVWVEVQDAEGKAIPSFTLGDCDEIIGDEIERTVTWKGNADVSSLSGNPVRLRFKMKDADLYSIQFRP